MKSEPGVVPFSITAAKREGLRSQRTGTRVRTYVETVLIAFVAVWAWLASGPSAPAVRWTTLALAVLASLALVLTFMLELEHEVDWPEPGPQEQLNPFDYRSLLRLRPGPAMLALAFAHGAALMGLVVHRAVTGGTLLAPWVPWVLCVLIGVVVLLAVPAALGSRRTPPAAPAPAVEKDGTVTAGPDQLVVACSGGGIRAAAFVLGGMHALQHWHGGAWAVAARPRTGTPPGPVAGRPAARRALRRAARRALRHPAHRHTSPRRPGSWR